MRNASFVPAEGVTEWLRLLHQYEVPMCLCAGTTLDLAGAHAVARCAGLDEYISHYVTAEDGCETLEQSYLVACVKTKRPPEKVVVFDNDPRGVIAAHEASIKAVAIVGSMVGGGNGSDLRHADKRVGTMGDLSLMSLRELFGDIAVR